MQIVIVIDQKLITIIISKKTCCHKNLSIKHDILSTVQLLLNLIIFRYKLYCEFMISDTIYFFHFPDLNILD